MKRAVAFLLTALMALSLAPLALAEPPAPESLHIAYENTDGDGCFSLETYPQVYLTIHPADKIIAGGSKKYPATFLYFLPPEGALPVAFSPNRAVFTVPDQQLTYYYYVQPRGRFNNYLNQVNKDDIIADGKDDLAAIYLGNEDHRAYALLALPGKTFSELGRLNLTIADHTGSRSREELTELVEDEAGRLLIDMTFDKQEAYWSEGAYTTAELTAEDDPVKATLDARGLILDTLYGPAALRYRLRTPEDKIRDVTVKLDPLSYAHLDHGEKITALDYTLADGTRGKILTYKGKNYAGFPVLEQASYGGGPLYLTFEMSVSEDEFPAMLEEAYARLTIEK